ncbi:solute carrier family 23 protein [Segatella copri]|uniref:solute carrier family 23 protein n=1 Tax=Segatella copri TaxID=165179 RepID=UPI003F5A7766
MDTEQLSMTKKTLVGVQFLFVAFGATVLVPLLIGIDPATALFTAGVGTFLFHFITKGKVPIFLGSSFAISDIGLSAVIGVVLNLVLPKTKKKEA